MQMPSLSPDPLRRLLDETSDLIDSPTATHILTLLLDTLFSQLTDVAVKQQAFKIPDPSFDPSAQVQEIIEGPDGSVSGATDPWQATAKLATILAVITRQAHMIGNGVPNIYVQAMEDVRELEAFAAVVYSSHFELEGILRGEREGERDESVVPPSRAAAEAAARAAAVASSAGAEAEEKGKGIVGSTWGMFESVWGRVSGK
jgi:peroxin-3